MIVEDPVLQEHISGLHPQVARAAHQIHEGALDVDHFVNVAEKQFTRDVKDLHDFEALLHTKSWYDTNVQALYRAIRFLFNGITKKLVKDHGKNHPTLLQVV